MSLIKEQWGQTRDKTVETDPHTLLSFFLSVDFNKFRVICVGIPGEISFYFFLISNKGEKNVERGLVVLHLSTIITYITELGSFITKIGCKLYK